MVQSLDEFMRQGRAILRGKDHLESITAEIYQESAKNKVLVFWKNFEAGLRRLLPSAVIEYLPDLEIELPITRYPGIELLLPGCLPIRIYFWTDANGIPQFREPPFLVPGAVIHLGQTEVIWNMEKGALYEPVFIDNLALAAAMAEDRSLRLWHTGHLPNKPELTYEPDTDQSIWEEFLDPD
jgi:hypothetical protein